MKIAVATVLLVACAPDAGDILHSASAATLNATTIPDLAQLANPAAYDVVATLDGGDQGAIAISLCSAAPSSFALYVLLPLLFVRRRSSLQNAVANRFGTSRLWFGRASRGGVRAAGARSQCG
jgi:hypothetical protein